MLTTAHLFASNADSPCQTFKENGLYVKRSPVESKSVFKALSNALYFTNKMAEQLQLHVLTHFINNFELFGEWHCFQTCESVLAFLRAPHLPQYQKLLFQTITHCISRQVKVYYLDQGFLSVDLFGPKCRRPVTIARIQAGHYSAVIKESKVSLFTDMQNYVLNIVEWALEPTKREKSIIDLNKGVLVNYEWQSWRAKADLGSVSELVEKTDCNSRLAAKSAHLNSCLLFMMHKRNSSSDLKQEIYGGLTEEAGLFEDPLTRAVIQKKLEAHCWSRKNSTTEEETKAEQAEYEQLLYLESQQIAESLGYQDDFGKLENDLCNRASFDEPPLSEQMLNDESENGSRSKSRGTSQQSGLQLNDESIEQIPTTALPPVFQGLPPVKKLKSKLALSKAKEFHVTESTSSTAPQITLPPPYYPSCTQPLPPPDTRPANSAVALRQNQEKADLGSLYSQSSVVTPFFTNEDEIAQNRVFSSLVSRIAETRPSNQREVVDPTVHRGVVKFFNDRNNFGFITTTINGVSEDIFAYRSEFEDRVQTHPIFKCPRLGANLVFEFNICTYFGKYKKSKKAMNIRVVEGLPDQFVSE